MATTKYLQLCACVTRLLVWWPPVWCGNSRRTLAANNHHHSENITRNRSIIVCCTGSINNSNLHSYSIRLTVQIKMQMLPCSHIQPSSATHTHTLTPRKRIVHVPKSTSKREQWFWTAITRRLCQKSRHRIDSVAVRVILNAPHIRPLARQHDCWPPNRVPIIVEDCT